MVSPSGTPEGRPSQGRGRRTRVNLFRITLRDIARSPGRFVSILLIVLLGAGFFAGMRATRPDMKRSRDAWLEAGRCEDLCARSAIGFTAAQLDAIARLPSVEKASGAYRLDAICRPSGSLAGGPLDGPSSERASDPGSAVVILSLSPGPDAIDEPHLFEGTMPSRLGECLAEIGPGGVRPAKVGDRIRLESRWAAASPGGGGASPGSREFLVTGIAQSPLFISYERGTNSLGSGTTSAYYMVLEEDARALALPPIPWKSGIGTGVFYSEARIRLKGTAGLGTSSDAYARLAEAAKGELRELATRELGSDRYWLVEGRAENAGIGGFEADAERVGKLGDLFPAVFFLVAALVSLTAMTRLVEEKRGEIGTLKALGYGSASILAQYLLYAGVATFGGGSLGVILGMRFLPKLIYSMYGLMYYVGPLDSRLDPLLGGQTVLLAFACTGGATALAAAREVLASPAALMRPRAPAPGKRVFLERIGFLWKRLGFLGKVTARNIFRYKKRFWMSVIGVAGCTGLLVAGFGMNDSLAALTARQFGEVYHYDALLFVASSGSDAGGEASVRRQSILERLRSIPGIASVDSLSLQGCSLGRPLAEGGSARAGAARAKLDAFVAVPERPGSLGRYVTLREGDRVFGLPDEGLVLTRKASELLGIRRGDGVVVESSGRRAELKVVEIADNYVFHFAYLSPAAYERAFGSQPDYGAIFCVESGASGVEARPGSSQARQSKAAFEAELGRLILATEGIARVSFISAETKLWDDIMDNMRYIIAVIIAAAGLLTLVVICTLTSINITERTRELATIKVLGFREAELRGYVFRENAALSLIGTALGLLFGLALHRAVVATTEVDACMFGRSVGVPSLVYAFLMSLLFALAANILMSRRLASIDMVEATKSVE